MTVDQRAPFFPQHTLSNTDRSLLQFWHPVATVDELPGNGRPLSVQLLGEAWALVQLNSELVALWDRCPHRLVPLSEGTVVGDRLQCRYHGYEFDAGGVCRAIPALPGQTPPTRIHVPVAPVRIAFGLVWLCPSADPAPFPFDDAVYLDPTLDGFLAGPFETEVDAGLLTDNFLDVTHLPFLHSLTFGASTAPFHDELRVERSGWSLTQSTDSMTTERGEALPVHYDYEVQAPFACQLAMTTLSGARIGQVDYVWSFAQPMTGNRTRWYMVQAYGGLGHDPEQIREAAAFQTRVGLEDLSILEAMPRPHLPLDDSECHTRGDKGCVTYRQIMKAIERGEERPTGRNRSVTQDRSPVSSLQ